MATYKTRPTNGTSYGIKYKVLSADVSAGTITFDFNFGSGPYRYPLVASVQILAASTNIVTNPVDMAVTYPSDGKITVTGTLVLNSVVCIVAQRASPSV